VGLEVLAEQQGVVVVSACHLIYLLINWPNIKRQAVLKHFAE
jgi:hypothetical protein